VFSLSEFARSSGKLELALVAFAIAATRDFVFSSSIPSGCYWLGVEKLKFMTNYERFLTAFLQELDEQGDYLVDMSFDHFLPAVEVHQSVETPRLSPSQRSELFDRFTEFKRGLRRKDSKN
jgi:hypothetical protein